MENKVEIQIEKIEPLLTTKNLIEYLSVTRQTIERWRKEGMPYLQLKGNIRFNRAEVMEWLQENRSSGSTKTKRDNISG